MYKVDRKAFVENVAFPVKCKCILCNEKCEGEIKDKFLSLRCLEEDILLNDIILKDVILSDNILVFEMGDNSKFCNKGMARLMVKVDGDIGKIAHALYWKTKNKHIDYEYEIAERSANADAIGYEAAMKYLFKKEVEKKYAKPSFWDRFKRGA